MTAILWKTMTVLIGYRSFFPPRPLKIYQHSGASYLKKKNVSFNQIGYGMCKNTFNKENTAQSYTTSA